MRTENLDQSGWKRNRPARPTGLGAAVDEPDLKKPLHGLPDVHEPFVQVDVRPAQRQQLAASKAECHPDREHRIEPVADGSTQELTRFLRRPRGAELDRADARRGGGQDLPALTAHAYRTRTAARNALYRLELSVTSTRISLEARRAFDLAKSVKDATTKEQTQERRDGTDTAITNLVQIAREIMKIRLQ
jgi:hypothetical protein